LRQIQVIWAWFETLGGFHAKSHEILTITFFSHIDGKQQQIHQKWCGEELGAKPNHMDWFATSTDFHGKSYEIWTWTFYRHIDNKQQQMNREWCGEALGAKPSHLGL